MIPVIYKLKLRKIVDFFQDSERYYSKYFLVFHRYKNESESQMIVVVPKKNIKLRVKRNSLKRLIYNLSLPLLKKTRGLSLVLVVNKKIATAKNKAVLDDIGEIFLRLNQQ